VLESGAGGDATLLVGAGLAGNIRQNTPLTLSLKNNTTKEAVSLDLNFGMLVFRNTGSQQGAARVGVNFSIREEASTFFPGEETLEVFNDDTLLGQINVPNEDGTELEIEVTVGQSRATLSVSIAKAPG
jgi:hypothetical protein